VSGSVKNEDEDRMGDKMQQHAKMECEFLSAASLCFCIYVIS
jgi:hypothetical protein